MSFNNNRIYQFSYLDKYIYIYIYKYKHESCFIKIIFNLCQKKNYIILNFNYPMVCMYTEIYV
jgi:hypothetical protein